MPELPEVETVRRGLARLVVDHRIERVEVSHDRVVRRTSRSDLVSGLQGAFITEVSRRGKYLLFALNSGSSFMVHLRMSGQVLIANPESERPRHSHVVLTLRSPEGSAPVEFRFVDPRTFGEVVAFTPKNFAERLPELVSLGPDPVVDGVGPEELSGALARTRRPIKAVLLDQRVVAGIGNIYGDEILHRARINPWRPANQVNRHQIRRLHGALHEILSEAIACGGSTLGDAQYVGVDGQPGEFQGQHKVYGRAGAVCVSCGRSKVVSARLGGRTTSWCRVCQR